MCRFLAYKGPSLLVEDLLYKPKNSLIHQSYEAQEYELPFNGDGFGVGWYTPQLSAAPGVFASVEPAWHNRNLRYLAAKIETGCLMAHVRAATLPHVSISNCHPFHYKNFLMMHNGDIGGFTSIRRQIAQSFSNEIYSWVDGQTDSQHFFGLFLDFLAKKQDKNHPTAETMALALEESIAFLENLQLKNGVSDPNYLNLAITDGQTMIACRYVSDSQYKALSLYYSKIGKYVCEPNGVCHMVTGSLKDPAILIVSEKLTDVEGDWIEVPVNHVVTIENDLTLGLRPIRT